MYLPKKQNTIQSAIHRQSIASIGRYNQLVSKLQAKNKIKIPFHRTLCILCRYRARNLNFQDNICRRGEAQRLTIGTAKQRDIDYQVSHRLRLRQRGKSKSYKKCNQTLHGSRSQTNFTRQTTPYCRQIRILRKFGKNIGRKNALGQLLEQEGSGTQCLSAVSSESSGRFRDSSRTLPHATNEPRQRVLRRTRENISTI